MSKDIAAGRYQAVFVFVVNLHPELSGNNDGHYEDW